MSANAATGNEVARGKLKIYLGYAPGVGKTFQMLSDAHQEARRGVDLVVGYFEAHKRVDTLALTEGLRSSRGARLSIATALLRKWTPRRSSVAGPVPGG
jgi:K+-sensing histidine kinase KdpD